MLAIFDGPTGHFWRVPRQQPSPAHLPYFTSCPMLAAALAVLVILAGPPAVPEGPLAIPDGAGHF